MASECTVVMYHYVRNMHQTPYPEIKGLLIDKFKGQLAYIMKNYSVISLENYVRFLNGQCEIPPNAAILSFDDGLKDHYRYVFPILKEKKVPACFFVPTKPLIDSKVLPVQKVQFLLAKLGVKVFAEQFNSHLRQHYPALLPLFFVDDQKRVSREGWYDEWDLTITSNLKYSIASMDWDVKNSLLDAIFSVHFDNEEEFCRDLYLNWEELLEMADAGMIIGSHSHSHPDLSKLTEEQQAQEIYHSKELLEKNLGRAVHHFCYPYGAFNATTIKLLQEAGFVCSLITIFDVNRGKINPYEIKRLDTNHLPQPVI